MRIIIAAFLLTLSSHLALAECTNQMEAIGQHQSVMKGMLDMNLKGKLNSENANAIGERVKLGQEAQNTGDYAKACKIYDSIIKDYSFQDAFAPKDGDKKTVQDSQSESTSDAETASVASSSAVAAPAKDEASEPGEE